MICRNRTKERNRMGFFFYKYEEATGKGELTATCPARFRDVGTRVIAIAMICTEFCLGFTLLLEPKI